MLRHDAHMLVLDTMARVVNGDENDADTYRGFYAHSGVRLKRLGVALLRLDHAGKDPGRGQRGSSGKNDDVDVVFRLDHAEDQVVLSWTHSRVSWVGDTFPTPPMTTPYQTTSHAPTTSRSGSTTANLTTSTG